MAAVLDDLTWILEKKNILESPFYGVLNACRVLEMIQKGEGIISSKEEAGLWALRTFPEDMRPIIQDALEAYKSNETISQKNRRTAGRKWNETALLEFRDFVKTMIIAEQVMKENKELLKRLSET